MLFSMLLFDGCFRSTRFPHAVSYVPKSRSDSHIWAVPIILHHRRAQNFNILHWPSGLQASSFKLQAFRDHQTHPHGTFSNDWPKVPGHTKNPLYYNGGNNDWPSSKSRYLVRREHPSASVGIEFNYNRMCTLIESNFNHARFT